MFCMFFPWILLPFWDIMYAKKTIFPRVSSGDLLLNEKQKKHFVSLNDEFTIIHWLLTTALLVQVDKALNGPDSNCFAMTPAWYEAGKNFFFALFLYFFQKSRYLFKKLHIGWGTGNRLFIQVIVTWIDWVSKQIPFRQKRDVKHYSSVD